MFIEVRPDAKTPDDGEPGLKVTGGGGKEDSSEKHNTGLGMGSWGPG